MSGARRGARGRASTIVAAAWLGVASGCVETPEPLDLELPDDDVFASPSEPSQRPRHAHDGWPLRQEPSLGGLERRMPRAYPLWPTPTDEPCPPVTFGRFEPQLDGGPMFERTTARLAAMERSRLSLTPTELTLLRDHVGVPGLLLVAASDTSSGCSMGWVHTHCFVSATDAYCPDGTARDLERLVRVYGLRPRSLTHAAWLELAVVLSGVERIVMEPALVRECTSVAGVVPRAPTVEVDDARVTVRFWGITEGRGAEHTVVVEHGGEVRMEAVEHWQDPPLEDVEDGVGVWSNGE